MCGVGAASCAAARAPSCEHSRDAGTPGRRRRRPPGALREIADAPMSLTIRCRLQHVSFDETRAHPLFCQLAQSRLAFIRGLPQWRISTSLHVYNFSNAPAQLRRSGQPVSLTRPAASSVERSPLYAAPYGGPWKSSWNCEQRHAAGGSTLHPRSLSACTQQTCACAQVAGCTIHTWW